MQDVVDWLMEGEAAIRLQTARDLLGQERPKLLCAVAREGDAAALLAARRPDGHWGRSFYQPKWTSTHYTLLELAGLGVPADTPACRDAVRRILADEKGRDGGINPSATIRASDVCINGMVLRYAAHFRAPAEPLDGVIRFVLGQQLPDGGFNCRSNRSGARISSVHTTTSVLEGLTATLRRPDAPHAAACRSARDAAVECLLARRLFLNRKTGEPLDAEFARLHHPARWRFDVLRGLDALAGAGVPYDERMGPALSVLRARRRPDGRWAGNRPYPGETHVTYPRAGEPHRWITLMALRVLAAYPERPPAATAG